MGGRHLGPLRQGRRRRRAVRRLARRPARRTDTRPPRGGMPTLTAISATSGGRCEHDPEAVARHADYPHDPPRLDRAAHVAAAVGRGARGSACRRTLSSSTGGRPAGGCGGSRCGSAAGGASRAPTGGPAWEGAGLVEKASRPNATRYPGRFRRSGYEWDRRQRRRNATRYRTLRTAFGAEGVAAQRDQIPATSGAGTAPASNAATRRRRSWHGSPPCHDRLKRVTSF